MNDAAARHVSLPFLIPASTAAWGRWLRSDLPDLAGILVGLIVARWAVRLLIRRGLRRIVRRAAEGRGQDATAAERRTLTIIATVSWFADVFLVFIGVALLLDNLGLDVTALIASAGIAGLGLTLGAQQLVRDLINGTFILAENQYTAGDRVSVAGVTGEVIEVNPRRTVVRDADGAIHSVPNSIIGVATNLTPGGGNLSIEVPVAYEVDLERAMAVIGETAAKLATDRREGIIELPAVVRPVRFSDTGTVVLVTGRVRPGVREELVAEMQVRIRAALAEAGIGMGRRPPPPPEVR